MSKLLFFVLFRFIESTRTMEPLTLTSHQILNTWVHANWNISWLLSLSLTLMLNKRTFGLWLIFIAVVFIVIIFTHLALAKLGQLSILNRIWSLNKVLLGNTKFISLTFTLIKELVFFTNGWRILVCSSSNRSDLHRLV